MTISDSKIRFGILGYADIARRKFIPALAATRSARLTALGSRNPDQEAALFPEAGQIVGYEQLLANTNVDVVYIALPNDLHEEWTIRALRAGKHVVCEKPLGLDLASVRRMVATARETGLLLYENIMYLHHPQHRMVREIVQSGAIGKIRQMRANFCFNQTRPNDFRLNPTKGGGSFHDQARYPLTAAIYHLQGEFSKFQGVTRRRNGLDVAITGSTLTTSDELFTFTIAFDQPYEAFYEIIGEHGSVRLDRAYTTPSDLVNPIKIKINDHEESRLTPAADHFQLMIEHVCRLITEGVDYAAEYQQIEKRAEIAEQIYLGCRGEQHG